MGLPSLVDSDAMACLATSLVGTIYLSWFARSLTLTRSGLSATQTAHVIDRRPDGARYRTAQLGRRRGMTSGVFHYSSIVAVGCRRGVKATRVKHVAVDNRYA